MSTPLDNHQPHGLVDGRLIDRLVDGELADGERRALLVRLEAEPDGWRRCALAFLEAQEWRATFGPLAAVARLPGAPAARGRKPWPWRPVAKLTAVAAGLAAAFALGWGLHGRPAAMPVHTPITIAETAGPAVEEPQPPEPEGAAPLPALAAKPWERRGFRADTQKRRVSMELKDGRRLEVPVEEVQLRYVGGRTY
jgi:hypothetical protein